MQRERSVRGTPLGSAQQGHRAQLRWTVLMLLFVSTGGGIVWAIFGRTIELPVVGSGSVLILTSIVWLPLVLRHFPATRNGHTLAPDAPTATLPLPRAATPDLTAPHVFSPEQAHALGKLVQQRRIMLISNDELLTRALVQELLPYHPEAVIVLGRSEAELAPLQQLWQTVQATPENGDMGTAVHVIVADLRFEHRLRQIFERYRPEIIIHSTPQHVTSISRQNAAEVVSHTVLATHTLLRVAREWQVARLLLISSTNTIQPTSVVAASNALTEQLVLHTAACDTVAYGVIRLGNLLLESAAGQPDRPHAARVPLPANAPHNQASRVASDTAAQRVMQALRLCHGGEIFVPELLPADAARQPLLSSGPLAGALHDCFAPHEEHHYHADERIFVGRATPLLHLENHISALATAARQNDTATLLYTLRTLLPNFNPHTSALHEEPQRSWHPSALPASERRLILAFGSMVVLGISAALTWWLTLTISAQPILDAHRWWLLLVATSWLVLAFINDSFSLAHIARPYRALRSIITTTLETGVLYLVLFFVFSFPVFTFDIPDVFELADPPRLMTTIYLLTVGGLASGWWLTYGAIFEQATRRRRAIVVGAGRSGRTLVQALQQAAHDYEVVGFIDDKPTLQHSLVDGVPVLGTRYDLLDQVHQTQAQEVILAITHDLHSDLLQVLMQCYEQGIPVKPMVLISEEVLGRIPVEHLGQHWFPTPFWNAPRMRGVQAMLKRVVDLGFALVGLLILAIFLPFIALAIRLDSPGSIFYTQEREGRGGRRFRIIKFRSMVSDAERAGKAVWATRDDPRITRVGKFMRRTRLDELPQFVNVLRGEMSIVGPRPERPQFVAQLQEEIPFYRARLSVKPGLTGWAQVKYRYGNTTEDALIKLQYDLYYIKHQSMVLDILILLRTIRVVLGFKGT